MSLIGILVALACIIGGNLLEGGHPGALLNLPAFLIVIGATFGAALTQFPFSVLGGVGKRFLWFLMPPKWDLLERSLLLQDLASQARKGGFLALEEKLDEIKINLKKKKVILCDDKGTDYPLEQTPGDVLEYAREQLDIARKMSEYYGEDSLFLKQKKVYVLSKYLTIPQILDKSLSTKGRGITIALA